MGARILFTMYVFVMSGIRLATRTSCLLGNNVVDNFSMTLSYIALMKDSFV
jgi:hypothetical protein